MAAEVRTEPGPGRRALLPVAAAVMAASLSSGLCGTVGPAAADSGAGQLVAWGNGYRGGLGTGATGAWSPALPVLTTGALAGATVVQVASGSEHQCAVTAAGVLACWGANSQGQLGTGTTVDAAAPVAITGGALAGRTVAQVSAGARHTCAVTTDGAVACWGTDTSGQLGNGAAGSVTTPTLVVTTGALAGKQVTQVAAGDESTCAVATGAAFCWGRNTEGQLGSTEPGDAQEPRAVWVGTAAQPAFLRGRMVTQVAVGQTHACARTADGGLACWGGNAEGQLGQPSTGACGTSQVACARLPLAVVTPGSVGAGSTGAGVLAGQSVASVGAGAQFTCALTAAGGVSCWGRNAEGQLGDGTTAAHGSPVWVATGQSSALFGTTVTQLSVGGVLACAAASSGTIACWGEAEFGGLAVPAPTACGDFPCAPTPLSLTGPAGSGIMAGRTGLLVSVGYANGLALLSVIPGTLPAAPTAIAAVPGDQRANVSWTAPADTGAPPAISTVVQSSTDGGATWHSVSGSPVAVPAASVQAQYLANNTPVVFRAALLNAIGLGPWSANSPPVTPVPPVGVTVPGAPTGVHAKAGDGQATVFWTAPASTGGAPMTNYVVQQSTDTGTTWQPTSWSPVSAPASGTSAEGLVNGVSVVFRVAAVNSAGTGPWSATSAAVIPAVAALPTVVRDLTAVSAAVGKAALAWQKPATGGPFTGYQVRFRRGAGQATRWRTVPPGHPWLALAGLTPGARYVFSVRAVNAHGAGPISSVALRIRDRLGPPRR